MSRICHDLSELQKIINNKILLRLKIINYIAQDSTACPLWMAWQIKNDSSCLNFENSEHTLNGKKIYFFGLCLVKFHLIPSFYIAYLLSFMACHNYFTNYEPSQPGKWADWSTQGTAFDYQQAEKLRWLLMYGFSGTWAHREEGSRDKRAALLITWPHVTSLPLWILCGIKPLSMVISVKPPVLQCFSCQLLGISIWCVFIPLLKTPIFLQPRLSWLIT